MNKNMINVLKEVYRLLWCLGLLHLTFTFILENNTINLVNIFIGLVLVIGAFISYE